MFRSTDEFKSPSRRLAQRWTFVADLFRELLPSEPPRNSSPAKTSSAPRARIRVHGSRRRVRRVLPGVFGIVVRQPRIASQSGGGGRVQAGLLQAAFVTDFQALDKLRAEVEGSA